MASVGEEYRRLHELHQQLKEVQDQLARGPRQIKARKARVAEAELALTEREKEFKEARASSDKKNLELRSKESHLNDLQAKLNQAASNREFDILRGQMDADRAAKAVLEDEILEWLDRADARQADIAEAKKQVQDVSRDTQVFADEFEKQSVQLRSQESELQGKIAVAEKIIPGEIIGQYRRQVAAHGADGMASTESGACGNCNVTLTAQNKVQINSGKLMFCSTCGSLLYPSH